MVNTNTNGSDGPMFLNLRELSRLLGCSDRHVLRLVERGLLPAPVYFGRLRRWSRRTIEMWDVAGCPTDREGVAA